MFDALTSERPYKKAWCVEDASKLLKDSVGSHFDPACVAAFFTDFDDVLAIKAQFVDEENEQRDDSV